MVKVSNENEVSAYHIIRILLAALFAGYAITIWIFPEYFSWAHNGVVRTAGHIYAVAYILLSVLVWAKGGIWFLEFTFNDDVYEFRYYILTAPFGAKRMVRIPVENLYAFAVRSSFLKLRKRLVLYQERSGKIFEYPPIPLGNLFLEKQKQVLEQLKKYGTEINP